MCFHVVGIRRVTVVVVVVGRARRVEAVVWVDCDAVTVDAVVVSFGVPGGAIELMSSVGESCWGVARRVLGRRDTVLREDWGVLLGGVVELMLLLVLELVASALLALALFLRPEDSEERVLPREDRMGAFVLAEDHISLRVRGDLDRLEWEEAGAGVWSMSISIASSVGGGG